ncbi:TPA: MliC family protein [Neisseria bacilliformis]|uniref:MliC family protein n=1 Tax=Neisseria bacilliformis TaxID=267212 RepID=UPI0006681F59|nr:MliC family protein [Neisseria bacilliformis]
MKAKILTALAAALALAACAAPEHDHDHERGHDHGRREHRHDHGGEGSEGQGGGRFECENGLSVQARRAGGNRMELNMDGKTAVLSGDIAASGERYVSANGLYGKATEWHQKGGEAYFEFTDPYGNKVETSCRAR